MVETSPNQVSGIQDVVVNDFTRIELVKEYFDTVKPIIEWNSKDNLIACIQFSNCLPFPESNFQKFIVEWQGNAHSIPVEKVIEEKMDILNDNDEGESIELNPENETEYEFTVESPDEEGPDYLRPDWIPVFKNDEQPKEVVLKRFIWSNGLYIVKDENNMKYQIEIESEKQAQRIFIRCCGKSKPAKDAFEYTISRLKLLSENVSVFIICTCKLCQKRGLEQAHSIKIEHLENLRKRYKPEVQCYGSGVLMRLDEISTVPRPSYKVVIINTIKTDDFCEQAISQFFPDKTPIIPEISTRKQFAGSEFENEYARKVANADIIIGLISLHLTGGNQEEDIRARTMLEQATERFKNKECLLLFLIIGDPSTGWENIPPFDDTEIPRLNQTPIYDIQNMQWSQIGNDLHRKITNWLKIKADQNA